MPKDCPSLRSPSMRDKPRFPALVSAVLSLADDLSALLPVPVGIRLTNP